MDSLPAYMNGLLLVLLLSSFVKIATTLSIVRFGIGLDGAGFGIAVIGLALALSILVSGSGPGSLQQNLFSGQGFNSWAQVVKTYRPFLEKNVDPEIHRQMKELSVRLHTTVPADAGPNSVERKRQPEGASRDSFAPLVAAFLISELKVAFQLGFVLLVPFIVLDLLVANAFLALGVVQLSHAVVAVPLKILLFFALDGWFLISQRLLMTYF